MSARLSDEELAYLERNASYGNGCVQASAMSTMLMAAELRERRAADLSEQDREALAFLRGEVMLELSHHDATEERTLALVQARGALDRLLSRGKDGR